MGRVIFYAAETENAFKEMMKSGVVNAVILRVNIANIRLNLIAGIKSTTTETD